MIKIKNATKDGYIMVKEGGVLDLSYPTSETRRGRVIDDGDTTPSLDTGYEVGCIQVAQLYGGGVEQNPQAGRVYSPDGLSPCLDSCSGGNRMPIVAVDPEQGAADPYGVLLDDGRVVRIRRLTPKECFRLQAWDDEDYEKAEFVNNASQLYKQVGNGVTVSVIEAIARKLS